MCSPWRKFFKVNVYTFRGNNFVIFIVTVTSHINYEHFIKRRISSTPIGTNSFLLGDFVLQVSKQEVTKIVYLYTSLCIAHLVMNGVGFVSYSFFLSVCLFFLTDFLFLISVFLFLISVFLSFFLIVILSL